MRHAAPDAAAEIERGFDIARHTLCPLDFVAGEVIAVGVEKLGLRGEQRVVLAGILIEIDFRHRRPFSNQRQCEAARRKINNTGMAQRRHQARSR